MRSLLTPEDPVPRPPYWRPRGTGRHAVTLVGRRQPYGAPSRDSRAGGSEGLRRRVLPVTETSAATDGAASADRAAVHEAATHEGAAQVAAAPTTEERAAGLGQIDAVALDNSWMSLRASAADP